MRGGLEGMRSGLGPDGGGQTTGGGTPFPGFDNANQPVGASVGGTSVKAAHADHQHPMLSFAGIAIGATQLSTFPSLNYSDGALAWVDSVGAWFRLQQSALTVDGITIIAATGKGGYQWVRIQEQNVSWQQQLTWSVDPQNVAANDENTGIDDAHPLKTMSELARRVQGAVYATGTACVVRLLSDMTAADSAYFDVVGVGFPGGAVASPYPSNSFFMIVGIPTATYTGAIAAPAQANAGSTGSENKFTDAGAPAFATAGVIWERTNGTAAYFWPQKDNGGNTFRISQPLSGFAQATLVAGDTWKIQLLPKIHDLSFPTTRDSTQYLIALCDERTSVVSPRVTYIRWTDCTFANSSLIPWGKLYNCRDWGARITSTLIDAGALEVSGGLISNANLAIPANSIIFLRSQTNPYLSFQGRTITADISSSVFDGDLCMFWDTVGDMISLSKNARWSSIVAASFGGSNNTGNIFNATQMGISIGLAAAPPAAMTTNATPLVVRGAASSCAALTAAGFLTDNNYLSTIAIN